MLFFLLLLNCELFISSDKPLNAASPIQIGNFGINHF